MKLSDIWNTIKSDVSNFFAKEKPVVDEAFSKANILLNLLKAMAGSATGQLIITLLEGFLPVGIVAAVTKDITIFLTDFKFATAEEGKSVGDIILDGLKAILGLSAKSKTLALSNLASVIGDSISNNTAPGSSTIQQAIISAPIVHDPTIIGVPAAEAPVVQLNEPAAQASNTNSAPPADDAAQEEAAPEVK